MTTHYIDLTVIPDPETSAPQLLGILYEKLHLLLVRDRIDQIGVSFPHYSVIPKTLGNTLRLHGTDTVLEQFQRADWLTGMRDHVRLGTINKAPEDALHRVIRRKQFKTNAERLRRRRMRRKGESEQHVRKIIPDTVETIPHLPYLHIRSRSTGQSFYLYIAMEPTQANPTPGAFNSYGLSTATTVPWF